MKMFRQKLAACMMVASVLIFLLLTAPTRTSANPSTELDSELNTIAKAALEAQYQILVSGDEEAALRSSTLSPAFEALIQGRSAELLEQREFLAAHQQSYSAFQTELTVNSIIITDSTAMVEATEYTILDLTVANGDPAAPDATEFMQDHLFTFAMAGDQWKLVSDQLLNMPGPVPPSPDELLMPLPAEVTPLDPTVSQAHYLYMPLLQTSLESEDSVEISPMAVAASLNRSAIVNYAYAYWQNYNSSYRNFNNSGTRGGDCTNFVSQAVRAGGWTDVNGWYRDNRYWWYNSFNQTWTWINAHYWAVFTANRPRSYTARYISDLVPGDILQVDFERDGTIDHSMIVTKKDSSGTIYITYHSNNTKDRSFWDFYNANRSAWYYGRRLYSSFN